MSWALLFWLSAGIVAYAYVAYPLLIVGLARLRRAKAWTDGERPPVTVLVAARNESGNIRRRIENLLEQDYPQDRLDVLVVVNGSEDTTADEIRAMASPRVRLVLADGSGGKASALAVGMEHVERDFVVFADARQRFDLHAVAALIRPFSDPSIGAVTGELMLEGDESGVGLYWRYEKAIRVAESRWDSTVGVTGAIYAIRRELWRAPPPGTLLDDVWVPMHVVRQGRRVIMVPEAVAFDAVHDDSTHEFRRKVRTLAGNFQLMRLAPWINVPGLNRLWPQWISHKVLRLLVPYCLLACLVSSLFADGWFYALAAVGQLLFYGAAMAGVVWQPQGTASALLGFPRTFVSLNWAAVVGLFSYLTGNAGSVWQARSTT